MVDLEPKDIDYERIRAQLLEEFAHYRDARDAATANMRRVDAELDDLTRRRLASTGSFLVD